MGLYNFPTNTCSSCSCGNDICTPDKIDNSCSLSSIRKTLLEIINAIKNEQLLGFNVDVEITTNDGILNTVNFSKVNINNIEVNKTTLITPSLAISLCDIAKITVVTSETTGSTFNSSLLASIRNITSSCVDPNSYYSGASLSGGYSSSNIQCSQGMQNYINQNIGLIDTVSYNGNSSKIETISVLSDIQKNNVVENSILNTTNAEVVGSATLTTNSTEVVNSITPSSQQVVSNVEVATKTVLTDSTPTTTEVSAPISTTPTTVVTKVSSSEGTTLVTSVNKTIKSVVEKVNSTTDNAVTGFTSPESITGVITGLDTLKNLATSSVNIPKLTSTGTGNLTVTIAEKSIDGTNPKSDITLNVKVSGNDISFNGNDAKFVLSESANVLGGNSNSPTIKTVNLLGTPTTSSFTKTVTPASINVIDTITPITVTGKLITDVSTTQINNVTTPTTKTVVESFTESTENVNVVSNVSTTTPDKLFTFTNTNVLNTAALNTNTSNVIGSASIANSVTPVISDLSTTTQNIYLPVKENIEGNIFAAGDGIMGVNNTNGNITVYSICDINTVQKQTPNNPITNNNIIDK